ncbi:Oidioi.mRNA.OKI2018_I69.chr2.g5386.t1.cds [Oikopleura dioica]|uniref:Oidioi.mRNA.OKI2018_I69.chr2.g5386.t1.cds n=1 Tax=Oikopleura dioica TaxID=34765 RepID=A0ABN7T646_OIKDI|nr:Oidioi.mRNA.OKI2018_I69.chr2.g5386.t1.cds [Oikopleura dioica]
MQWLKIEQKWMINEPVPPGLEVQAVISIDRNCFDFASFPFPLGEIRIKVDDAIIPFPLLAKNSCPQLVVDQTISFGNVSDSNNIIKKKLKIKNKGDERGFFQIQKRENEVVKFSSYSGYVDPKEEVFVTAKMIADCRKEINEEIQIFLGDREESIKIKAQVISRKLKLSSEILQLGDFIASAEGRGSVFLENPTPDSVQWVSRIPLDADGVEFGPFESPTEIIQLNPSSGTLAPGEKCLISIKLESRKKLEKFTELILNVVFGVVGKAFSENSTVGLFVTANLFPLKLKISSLAKNVKQSSKITKIYFGEAVLGTTPIVILDFENLSGIEINLQASKIAHFKIAPKNLLIGPNETKKVTFIMDPSQIGNISSRFDFNVVVGKGSKIVEKAKFLLEGHVKPRKANMKKIEERLESVRQSYIPPLNEFEPKYKMTPAEKKQRDSHVAKYNAEISKTATALRNKRSKQETRERFERRNNPVEIGLSPIESTMIDFTPEESPGFALRKRDDPQMTLGKYKISSGKEKWKKLSANDSEMIKIGNLTKDNVLDFGEVLHGSEGTAILPVENRLLEDVVMEISTTSEKVTFYTPSSFIIPGRTLIEIAVSYSASDIGPIGSSLQYSLNKGLSSFVLLSGKVSPPRLEIPEDSISLRFNPNQSDTSEMTSSIEIRNPLNMPLEFLWQPVIPEDSAGFGFSMRPASGMILARSSLKCEVNYYPSFLAPHNGAFKLKIEGNSYMVKCNAIIPRAEVLFTDRKVNFGPIPLNSKSTRRVYLKNVLSNPAIFRFDQPRGVPISISPIEGIIPVGGILPVDLELYPTTMKKLEFSVIAQVKNGEDAVLRVAAHVQEPKIVLSVEKFIYHGVPVGCYKKIPFEISNPTKAPVSLKFNLKNLPFSVEHSGERISKRRLEAGEEIRLDLVYRPAQVEQKTLPFSILANTIDLGSNNFEITATAKRKPVFVKTTDSTFKVKNISDASICIKYNDDTNLLKPDEVFETELFEEKEFQILDMNGHSFHHPIPETCSQPAPGLEFEPKEIVFEAAPLNTELQGVLKIKNTFSEDSSIAMREQVLEEFERLDISFSENSSMSSDMIIMKISYLTMVPFAGVKTLEFFEETTGETFPVNIYICCDNSLTTCYQYVAERLTSHHIVEQSEGGGRASLNFQESDEGNQSQSRKTNSVVRARTKSTSISVSTEIMSFGSSSSPHSSSFPVTLQSREQVPGRATSSIDAFSSLESDLVSSLEKWFGTFGWSSGPFPISIPTTIRSLTSRAVGKTKGTGRILAGTRSQMVTVYDMIVNLSGRTITGFPAGQLLPENKEEKRAQLLWQYGVILEVIKAQGGMVAHINAEDLLEENESLAESKRLDFEKRSQNAWTNFLLQVFRVFSLAKVEKYLPGIDASHIESNIYDGSEKIILAWLNEVFEQVRGPVFGVERRTIINFDNDLRDGLVLGSLVAFYCPYFIEDLKKMFVSCTMAEQCLHNALILLEIFKKIRIEMVPLATQITDPNPITMLMLLVNVAEVLPAMKPIDIAYLNGKLSQECKKTFTIKNRFKKAVQYEAFIISNNEQSFSTSNEKFSIPPKSSFSLVVNFKSSFFLKTEAILVVKSLPTPAFPVQAETLVFTLKGNISEFSPREFVREAVKCPVYEEKQIEIEINCPLKFEGQREFTVSSLETHRVGKSSYHLDELLEEMENNVFPREFYASDETLQLDCEKSVFKLFYNPIGQIQKSGIFIFSNEEIGQFAIKINGSPLPPKPSPILRGQEKCFTVSGDQIFWKTSVTGSKEAVLKIYGENVAFQNALQRVVKLSLPKREKEIREKTFSLNTRALQEKVVSPDFYKKIRKFEVFSTSEHFRLPKTIEIDTSTPQVEIPIQLLTDQQGRYPGLIFFQGTEDSLLDTRIIQLEAIITAECESKNLILEAPAREQVDQLIPIQNMTPHVWQMTATLRIQENSAAGFAQERDPFSGPEFFTVQPGETYNYRLLFSPMFKKTYKADLNLVNKTDGSAASFHITGVGKNPKVSQKLTFHSVKCDSPRKASIIVPNLGRRKMQFQLHTTLGSIIAGPLSITVEKNSSAEYIFEIIPPEIDRYRGLLVFAGQELYKTNNPDYDSDHEDDFNGENGDELVEMPYGEEFLLLYELDISSVRSDPAKRLKFSGSCGEWLSKTIELNNPTERDFIFKIKSSNLEILKVEEAVKIPPHSKKPLEILFMPENASDPTPADLTFESDLTGKFWYQIEFYLEDPLPKLVKAKDVPFGKWESLTVQVTNTSIKETTFTFSTSSPDLFLDPNHLPAEKFTAKETKDIHLFFIPHQLGKSISTFIASSPDCGKTIVDVEGEAVPPKQYEPTKIFAKANSPNGKTVVIPFRNPSDKSILCSVDLKMSKGQEQHSDAFQVLLKKRVPIALAKGEVLEIPVSFISEGELESVVAFVTVTARPKDNSPWLQINPEKDLPEGYTVDSAGNVTTITFTYPLHGSTLFKVPEEKQLLIECNARSRFERKIELSLNGAAPNILPTVPLRTKSAQNASGYSFDLLFTEESVFAKAISISLVGQKIDQESGEVKLVFCLTFMPMIGGVNEKAVLSISSAIGATWRFPLELRVTEPPADDEICIPGCKIGSSSVVRFRLFGENIAFNAKLLENAKEEDSLFEISPEEGVLTPDGLEFSITYTPKVFGEKASSRLLVSTSDKTLTYDITTVPAAPRRNQMTSSAYGKIYARPKKEPKNYVLQNKMMTRKKANLLKLESLN